MTLTEGPSWWFWFAQGALWGATTFNLWSAYWYFKKKRELLTMVKHFDTELQAWREHERLAARARATLLGQRGEHRAGH